MEINIKNLHLTNINIRITVILNTWVHTYNKIMKRVLQISYILIIVHSHLTSFRLIIWRKITTVSLQITFYTEHKIILSWELRYSSSLDDHLCPLRNAFIGVHNKSHAMWCDMGAWTWYVANSQPTGFQISCRSATECLWTDGRG